MRDNKLWLRRIDIGKISNIEGLDKQSLLSDLVLNESDLIEICGLEHKGWRVF